jgi:hypothetical protein
MTTSIETTARVERLPLFSRLLLGDRPRIRERLEEIAASGLLETVPNEFQLSLAALRMAHRILFRSETVGTCTTHPVRATWRARILQWRPARFPFLVKERAIAPFDLTGLRSDEDRIFRHLLGAHHDGDQFVYDLQMLAATPGALQRLRERVVEQLTHDTPRTRWLRDLVVFEGYHEALLAAVERAIEGDLKVSGPDDGAPDITFFASMRWCARQPRDLAELQRARAEGRWTVRDGVREGAHQ